MENGGGGGGVDAPVERIRVERTVWENEKKKENEWNEWAGQREQMVSVKMSGGEWWVVGLGGSKHGPQKCWPIFFLYIYIYITGGTLQPKYVVYY